MDRRSFIKWLGVGTAGIVVAPASALADVHRHVPLPGNLTAQSVGGFVGVTIRGFDAIGRALETSPLVVAGEIEIPNDFAVITGLSAVAGTPSEFVLRHEGKAVYMCSLDSRGYERQFFNPVVLPNANPLLGGFGG